MRRHLTLLALTAALLALAAPAYGGDTDCSDFKTQAQAQRHFDSLGGGPSDNVDGLDRDSDGIACESNDRGASALPRSGSDTPADRGERLARTGPGNIGPVFAAGLFAVGLLLVAATRYRPRHSR